MVFIDYYKVLEIEKQRRRLILKKRTANWQENYTPILTQMTKKPTKNFRQ